MLKLLLLTLFIITSANARVLSGHHEFVHYTEEQKKDFVVKVMEFTVELDALYEKAPVEEKQKYTLILEELRKIMIGDAYAATTDLNSFANDLTRIFDPNKDDDKRCIYAGWASRTITTKIGNETREICQHPKFIKGGANSEETKAYNKSSDCGKKTQNTISCNPAIFGFKNKQAGSQFCVPAGPKYSENSSYACMQLSLGVKKEAGADPSEERISYLKKQFEGNPALVNNLYGFIYKTCICDPDNQNVINKSYLARTRPHRTCLGLINTIAETEHCVDYSGMKSSEMTLFKELRTFTSELMTSKASGLKVDSNYRELLSSIPSKFAEDYSKMCGGVPFPPPGFPDGNGDGDGSGIGDGDGNGDNPKTCNGECDFIDGKYTNCTFKDGENTLNVTPPESITESFSTEVEGVQYLCSVNKRAVNDSGDKPKIELIPKKDNPDSVDFDTNIDGDGEGWGYHWSRKDDEPKEPKKDQPGPIVQPDTKTDGNGNGDSGEEPDKVDDDLNNPKEEEPKDDKKDGEKDISNDGKTYSAPKEDTGYTVCVELVKDGVKSNQDCKPVEKKDSAASATQAPKLPINGNGAPRMTPQTPMRRGVDFSRRGIL